MLELMRRELEAEDARIQLGGARPESPRELVHEIRANAYVVVRFAEPPEDAAAISERLTELSHAFAGTVRDAIEQLDTTLPRVPNGDELVEVLADLRDICGAALAFVIDRQSPVIWGCSDPGLGLRDRPAALRLSEALDELRSHGVDPLSAAAATEQSNESQLTSLSSGARRALQQAEQAQAGGASQLLAAVEALAALGGGDEETSEQPTDTQPGVASKEFGNLYRVVLVFTCEYSPLRIEGVLRRALPVIERHVLELPPLDPTPKGGRVVPLRRD